MFDLDDFLSTYKPKVDDLSVYKNQRKLRQYTLLDKKESLMPRKMWIKYITHEARAKDKRYAKHVKPGGMLLCTGSFVKGRFIKGDKYPTHMVLRYKDRDQEATTFMLKIDRCIIFWRPINREKLLKISMLDDDSIESIIDGFIRKVSKDKERFSN